MSVVQPLFKVYKVVTRHALKNGIVYYSACENPSFPASMRVTYEVGETSYPYWDSLLFAFTDLNDAMNFANDSYHRVVFEAETNKLYKGITPQRFRYTETSSFEVLKEFWDNINKARKGKKKIPKEGDFPQGINETYKSTVCCPWIRLIKKVY